jgi:branched-subunit amino acid permease
LKGHDDVYCSSFVPLPHGQSVLPFSCTCSHETYKLIQERKIFSCFYFLIFFSLALIFSCVPLPQVESVGKVPRKRVKLRILLINSHKNFSCSLESSHFNWITFFMKGLNLNLLKMFKIQEINFCTKIACEIFSNHFLFS